MSTSSSIPITEYTLLVQQGFRCAAGVPHYDCPLGSFRTFDIAGYAVHAGKAYCPSCVRVLQQQSLPKTKPVNSQANVIAKQRIIQFLALMRWTVGNGEYVVPWSDFWGAFYDWAEHERMFTKKQVVRQVLTDMCKIPYDSRLIPITPVVH